MECGDRLYTVKFAVSIRDIQYPLHRMDTAFLYPKASSRGFSGVKATTNQREERHSQGRQVLQDRVEELERQERRLQHQVDFLEGSLVVVEESLSDDEAGPSTGNKSGEVVASAGIENQRGRRLRGRGSEEREGK